MKTVSRFILDNAINKINEKLQPYGNIIGCEYNLRVVNTISDGDNLEYLIVQIRPLDRDGETLFYRIPVLYNQEIIQCDYNGNIINDTQSSPSSKEDTVHMEQRKFVYFIEDTHHSKQGLWLGLEYYPETSWTGGIKAWTNDPLKAFPFKTFREADKIRVELNMDGYIVTEHEFVNERYIDKSQNVQSEDKDTVHMEIEYPRPLVKFLLDTYGLLVTEAEALKILNDTASVPDITKPSTPLTETNKHEKEAEERYPMPNRRDYSDNSAGTAEYTMDRMLCRTLREKLIKIRNLSSNEKIDELVEFTKSLEAGFGNFVTINYILSKANEIRNR